MSEHERKNLTFNPHVLDLAEQLMRLRHFSDLSGFLSQLVREEHERRHGPTLYDQPIKATAPSPAPPRPSGPASYRKTRPRGRKHN